MPRKLFALSLLAALGTVSCNTISQPKGSSRGYESARLAIPASLQKSDALEDSPEVHQMIRNGIQLAFEKNGMSFGGSDTDLVVAFMLIRQTPGMTAANQDYFGSGRDAQAIIDEAHERGVVKAKRADSFTTGTIILDVLDTKTNKLIFRNYTKGDVMKGISPEARAQRINNVVAELLEPFFR